MGEGRIDETEPSKKKNLANYKFISQNWYWTDPCKAFTSHGRLR
jgi:hypothetical protein